MSDAEDVGGPVEAGELTGGTGEPTGEAGAPDTLRDGATGSTEGRDDATSAQGRQKSPAESRPGRRRLRGLALMVAFVVIAMLTGIIAARFIKSPSQQALESAPPPLTPMSDTVRNSVVFESVAMGGTVQRTGSTSIDTAITGAGDKAVVSGVRVRKGASVKAGDVLLEVSSRPVIALVGAVPQFRAMSPGMSGSDVDQLQDALRAAGFMKGKESGFGPLTEAAVTNLYAKAGYPVVETGREDVRSALDEAESAKDALEDARAQLSDAERGTSAGTAEPGTTDTTGSGSGVDQARRAVTRAERAREKAVERLEQARSKAGATIPMGEIAFVPTLPAAVAEVKATVGKPLDGPALTLATGGLGVRCDDLEPLLVERIRTGMSANVIAEDGSKVPASVVSVANGQSESSKGERGVVVVKLTKTTAKGGAKPPAIGQQVRVVVATSATDTPVLNVASGAVVAEADGSTHVVVRPTSGPTRTVPVTTGAQGDGRVEVRGDLSEGDTVLITVEPTPR